MIFTASRGQAFTEEFTFKNESGQLRNVPAGDYVLTLERGDWVKEMALKITRNTIYWNMTAEQTKALPFSTLYFTLEYKGMQIARGVLRVNERGMSTNG